MSAVVVRGIGKSYRYGSAGGPSYRTLRESLLRGLRRPSSPRVDQKQPASFWALRDVSLTVNEGEVLGIIGRNGAGKTTLLKILSRITEPTTGTAEIRGRVGSLLEVGTGFHPELTGRENILLNGAILGMTRAEIGERFDEIVSFSELHDFLDTPVKHYSSGMYTRLAFAVAAHLDPEILMIDEVLSVGDAAFQRKCLGKMGEVTSAGRTILFVSHNLAAVESLCDRVAWLERGSVREIGAPHRIIGEYLKDGASARRSINWLDTPRADDPGPVRLIRAGVDPATGDASEQLTVRTPLSLWIELEVRERGFDFGLAANLVNEKGVLVCCPALVSSQSAMKEVGAPQGRFRLSCDIPGDVLNNGVYAVDFLLTTAGGRAFHREDGALGFELADSSDLRGGFHGEWPGVIRPNWSWGLEWLGSA